MMIQRIVVLLIISIVIITGCVEKDVTLITPTPILTSTPVYTPLPTQITSTPVETSLPTPVTVSGIVADCSYSYGSKVSIPNAIISYAGENITADKEGNFSFSLTGEESDPVLEITAPGYMPYRERPSRMVNGAFYLIPKNLYRGVYLVLWNPEKYNPQNLHRKWEQQTEFVIVQTGASENQINTLRAILAKDEYLKMTGGRFTSNITPTIVKEKPVGNDRINKTVISFSHGGGGAHSEDINGIIYYAEIIWDTSQVLGPTVIWHEMVHTVTSGGHINEWPSVVSEVQDTHGRVTETDEKIFNCIYNSPPLRGETNPPYNYSSSKVKVPIISGQSYWENLTNSIGMEFVEIPEGEFDMGSPSSEKYRKFNEGPVHHVNISYNFYMGKYEVTQKQWRDVMGNDPSFFKGDDLPVEQVSWNDVHIFIKKLNEIEGTDKYRLPSEAEWEYAARAGTTTMYSYGNNESELGDYAWYIGNSNGTTHAVGQKKPNPWGLYDMHGNVWDWVQDSWHDSYDGAPSNGSAWVSIDTPFKVDRGGVFRQGIDKSRSAMRLNDHIDGRFSGVGFRLARDI
jgi:formylglycine-generating enzyme required for sulfatase activity